MFFIISPKQSLLTLPLARVFDTINSDPLADVERRDADAVISLIRERRRDGHMMGKWVVGQRRDKTP